MSIKIDKAMVQTCVARFKECCVAMENIDLTKEELSSLESSANTCYKLLQAHYNSSVPMSRYPSFTVWFMEITK